MINEDVAKRLNNLIELLHDSRDGYRECAEEVKDTFFKQLFTKLSSLRSQMITELQQKASLLNVKYEKSGSTLAAGHRLFIDLKSMLTGGKADALIEEVKRGEHYAIESYESALKDNLPPDLAQIVRKQLEELRSNLNQVKLEQSIN